MRWGSEPFPVAPHLLVVVHCQLVAQLHLDRLLLGLQVREGEATSVGPRQAAAAMAAAQGWGLASERRAAIQTLPRHPNHKRAPAAHEEAGNQACGLGLGPLAPAGLGALALGLRAAHGAGLAGAGGRRASAFSRCRRRRGPGAASEAIQLCGWSINERGAQPQFLPSQNLENWLRLPAARCPEGIRGSHDNDRSALRCAEQPQPAAGASGGGHISGQRRRPTPPLASNSVYTAAAYRAPTGRPFLSTPCQIPNQSHCAKHAPLCAALGRPPLSVPRTIPHIPAAQLTCLPSVAPCYPHSLRPP